jgi:aerobic carbon-monoxide dehydrogenase large subunit
MAVSELIGARIRRREDPELITGTGTYVDDVSQTGTVHMYVLRSNLAHARIAGVDVTGARDADGVVAVFTGKELEADFKGTIPAGVAFIPDKKVPPHHPIAIDKVRYVGEPVAIVLASSRAAAEDAAERIDVRYEPLPAVVDIEKALKPGAPLLHEELGSNKSF